MPFTVACPHCNADGTGKANAMLAQMPIVEMVEPLPLPVAACALVPTAAPPPPIPVRVTAALSAPAFPARPGARTQTISQEDRDKAEVEARAKILWGDKQDEVVKFLMWRGFTNDEASEKVRAMIKERYRTIRADGIVKTIGGSVIAIGTAGALLGMWKVGFFSPFVAGVVGLACVAGLWMFFKGLLKILSPGSEGGDALEND